MEPNSTQAVTPTSTTVEPSVKRLRKGDVREDGKIFWRYVPRCANGEYWLSPEKFAVKKAAEEAQRAKKKAELSAKKAALPTKLRQGDTSEDGKRFWCYGPNYVNGEWWMTPEQYAAKKGVNKAEYAEKKADLSAKQAALSAKLHRGDVREDGKIFWQYSPSYPNGEWWLTPEEFAAKKAKRNARNRDRYTTDPLFALKCRLRDRMSKALKRKGFKKSTKTAIMLGCTYEEFKAHIESKFLPSMSWANFSDGHIDHLVPLDAAKTEEDVYALNHFTNLRPIWGPDNQSKSSKLPEEHELPDNLHTKVKEIYLTAKARSA